MNSYRFRRHVENGTGGRVRIKLEVDHHPVVLGQSELRNPHEQGHSHIAVLRSDTRPGGRRGVSCKGTRESPWAQRQPTCIRDTMGRLLDRTEMGRILPRLDIERTSTSETHRASAPSPLKPALADESARELCRVKRAKIVEALPHADKLHR